MLKRAMIVMMSASWVASLGCEEPQPTQSADASTGGEPLSAGIEGGGATADMGGVSAGETSAGIQVSGGTWVSGQEAGVEAGTSAQAGESAGAQAGSPPPVMEEEEEVTCLRSCVDFVECAIDSCEGYDDSDTRFLMNECLSVCIDPIARSFDRLKNCDDKLRFAFTFRADFGQYCGSISEGFCETFTETCGDWTGGVSCEEHYNNAPERGEALSEGAHRACYEYHLSDARRALNRGELEEAQLRCEHAAGLSVCVD